MAEKKPISIASRKNKGRSLQKWTCEQISDLLGIPWGSDDDSEITPRPMSQNGPDVILSKRVRELFPYTIECKNQESWSLLPYIKQVKDSLYTETDWIIVLKKNKIKPLIIIDAEVFFKILAKTINIDRS